MVTVITCSFVALSTTGTIPAPVTRCGQALLLLWGLSLVNDQQEVHPGYRLAVHLMAGAILAGNLAPVPAQWVPEALLGLVFIWYVLGIAWAVNLFNFMDGMDGLAAAMGFLGFAGLAAIGIIKGDSGYTVANAAVAASVAGFGLHNFPPARIFMGDSGSTILGLLAAASSLWAVQSELVPPLVPCILFFPFVADATVTLWRRAVSGRALWQPHREHHYQRLVLAGWSQRRVLLLYFGFIVLCVMAAVATVWFDSTGWPAMGLVVAAGAGIGRLVKRVETERGKHALPLPRVTHCGECKQ